MQQALQKTALSPLARGKGRVDIGDEDIACRSRREIKTALKLSEATDYNLTSIIDFVSPVKQKTLLDELDALPLSERMCGCRAMRQTVNCLTDILSPEEAFEIGYYGIGLKSGTKQTCSQVSIEDYVAELQDGECRRDCRHGYPAGQPRYSGGGGW